MFNKIINIGVRPDYELWEIYLTRKINTIALIAICNITIGIVFFSILDLKELLPVNFIVLLAGPLVWFFNKVKNYVWAAYTFFIIGFIFFVFINLQMGKESYVIMFYFPVIISMVQLLGRRETVKHLIPLGIICIISVIIILVGFQKNWLHYDLSPTVIKYLAWFDILLSLFTALAFIIIIVTESLKQEKLIKSMLNEKEILLAEVFHRVKNNMNIVTSLLNLKKNSTDSPEVKEALEECRSRVYSMALVHQKVFNSNNIVSLNFKDYVQDLVSEIINSLEGIKKVKTKLDIEDVSFELSNAIPCGLILNELITNSYKYTGQNGQLIEIGITLNRVGNLVEIEVRDNGPGITKEELNKPNSLGIELIKSLAEQIDAEYSFTNQNGMVFNMKFKQ
jgi:two-component sensor histidine kinase